MGIFRDITKTLKKAAPIIGAGIGMYFGGPMGASIGSGIDDEVYTSKEERPFAVGKTRLGTGRIGNKLYNLDDEDERRQYFEDNRKRQGAEDIESPEDRDRNFLEFNYGGEVNGPGTGTSDSVPARLSDGEFVVTAQAVRGAGGGDRNVGAARMYDMMSELERVA